MKRKITEKQREELFEQLAVELIDTSLTLKTPEFAWSGSSIGTQRE